MTDAEINEAVARALGLPGVKTYATGIVYVDITDPAFTEYDRQATGMRQRAVDWATSLDACFRDLVPEATLRGFTSTIESHPGGGSWAAFIPADPNAKPYEWCVSHPDNGLDTAPRALCLAWLKTMVLA